MTAPATPPHRPTSTALRRVVADDLSGAAEVAGVLLARGRDCQVVLDGSPATPSPVPPQPGDEGVTTVVDTDHRADDPASARDAVRAATADPAGAALVVVKVDSLWRGNVGPPSTRCATTVSRSSSPARCRRWAGPCGGVALRRRPPARRHRVVGARTAPRAASRGGPAGRAGHRRPPRRPARRVDARRAGPVGARRGETDADLRAARPPPSTPWPAAVAWPSWAAPPSSPPSPTPRPRRPAAPPPPSWRPGTGRWSSRSAAARPRPLRRPRTCEQPPSWTITPTC